MIDFKAQKIKRVIKDLLKKKRITYEELARQMECSVPTIKRILGPEELTLSRLLQLCEIVEIDFSDLDVLTKEGEQGEEHFTAEQEAFLAKNKAYFAYLMKLFVGETPSQIAEANGLSQRSTDRYLIGLEKHGLIRVTGRQKIKPAFRSVPALGRGPLAKMYSETLVKNASSFFLTMLRERLYSNSRAGSDSPRHTFGIHSSQISKETYMRWLEEQEKAIKDLEQLSRYEAKVRDPASLKTAVILNASALVDSGHQALSILEHTFGKVPNL